jgi:carboxyl-terminal processing protease
MLQVGNITAATSVTPHQVAHSVTAPPRLFWLYFILGSHALGRRRDHWVRTMDRLRRLFAPSSPHDRVGRGKAGRLVVWSLALAAPFIASGCSSVISPVPESAELGLPVDDGFVARRVYDTFREGYRGVADKYIDPVAIGAVTLRGLQALAKLDDGFDVDREGAEVVMRRPADLRLPAPRDDDVSGWSRVATETLRWARVHSDKLRGHDPEDLLKVVFNAGLASLDPNSRYENRDETKRDHEMRGGYFGIGVRMDPKVVGRLMTVFDGGPAAKAGLMVGDMIVGVDGADTRGLELLDLVRKLRGEGRTPVRLALVRGVAETPFERTVDRAHVIEPSVEYRREPGNVAYLRVSTFNKGTLDHLEARYREAKADMGGRVRGVILDLRSNTGGDFNVGIGVADFFLPTMRGAIVSTRGRMDGSTRAYPASGTDQTGGVPVVVLIDGQSASASEIVAAALHDSRRAILVGQRSYGKGSVQVLHPITANGSQMKLTQSRFYGPGGYALDQLGVMPTLCLGEDGPTQDALIASLREGRVDVASTVRARRDADLLPREERQAFGASCPQLPKPRREIAGLDLEVEAAKAILAEPTVVSRALRGQPLVGQRRNHLTPQAQPLASRASR